MAETGTHHSPKGLLISSTLYLDPSKVDAFFELLGPTWKHAKETPECRTFAVGVNKKDDVVEVKLTEAWDTTREWLFTVQASKPYVGEFYGAVELLEVKPRVVEILDYVPVWTYSA
ncbi:hypothetical protein BDN72DRAFT_894050 [Pluteus cervinus]|uniref:Uncharacterized protein n=1 Tax=Pluteus cervinus TaxID=181527 RepID=A0ACD3B5X0_9AGAR|nr:hypothetical protein BDN72DRAFT_894050 [Pluteus cervinus]